MKAHISPAAQRVEDALLAFGFESRVVELPASTRTAVDAANAIGCAIGQIVKSLVFQTVNSQQPILVIASGANRVNEDRVGELVGESIVKASPDFVRQSTGYAIGGVPPVALAQTMRIFIDQDLMMYEDIWAAAGTPHAVFRTTPAELKLISAGVVTAIN